ncbi:hypothetical protein PLESTB_001830200 [Pleodorina starrii]|uniref:Rhodanese domain-containing protein n=2 Tax=cellular organisms TaxID=131567 RepID=A0A9W6C215_9CHLO|nr:hypothetical protein PLESTB_001830200 [Pleodorina starrii]
MPAPNAISVDKLARIIGTPRAPVILDVRSETDFAADPSLVPGAIRADDRALADLPPLPPGPMLVLCQAGHRRSQGAAAWLRAEGRQAEYLDGGFVAWREAGLPLIQTDHLPPRDGQGRTVWVTRARPKIDRIACPWLIRRFVDPRAVILFVAPSEVSGVAERHEAAPFDIEDVFFSHRGDLCSFDVMLAELGLSVPALDRLAVIVRAADTARLDLAPEAAGLLAVSLGLSRMYADDLEQLEAGMLVYDALYRMMQTRPYPTLAEATRVWARIGLLSFGGPAGQIALMHRILVEEQKWLGERRFLHALNYCMLLPGPEAMQLAVYIGWLMHRTLGGIIAGLLFVLPGVVAIMSLSWVYAIWGNTGVLEGLFFGLKAAVLAIVVQAVIRIGSRALKNRTMIGIAAASFLAIFAFSVPFPVIILTAALVGFVGARAGLAAFQGGGGHGKMGGTQVADADTLLGEGTPDHTRVSAGWAARISAVFLGLWLVPVAALFLILGPENVFSQIAGFFSVMAVVTFGGAYAVLAYVAQQAVETYGWLAPGEMLDGLGMAETTPGPLIMVTQFVGFMGALREAGGLPPLLAGTLGGLLTTWVTFLPCFLWIFLGAPFIERLRDNHALTAALTAVTAAVVGVILNLALWFGLHVLFEQLRPVAAMGLDMDLPVWGTLDVAALALVIVAILAVFRLKLGAVTVLAICAFAGLFLRLVGVV